ncbi:MAG TPA: hypothetical protein VLM89_13765 [Phycisphaerae bacterium]|nr:hypothetical protein [Phycisphaerae bacterium]
MRLFLCNGGLWLSVVACGLAPAIASATGGPAVKSQADDPSVLDVGERRQVFIDGRFMANSRDVELVVHPPRKTGERTLVADKPWEGRDIDNNCTVMKQGDTYHLWYPAHELCYARSKDGIHWEKPSLGLAEVDGSRDNNIVLGRGAGGIDRCSSEGMVFHDPTAPEDQRFRYATRISDELKDTFVFSSPDGIHWRKTHDKVLTFTQPDGRQYLDSQNVIFWDDRIRKYVAYMRFNWFIEGFRGRSVARSESDHLGGFAEVQDALVVLGPDALDASLGDLPVVDFYSSAAIKYPWAQDAYYMFPAAYFCYPPGRLPEFPDECPVNSGPIHTQFAASRDGITWHRFDRRPFVALGMKGEFDSMSTRVFHGLVPSVDGREMFLYYVGSDMQHGWDRDDRNKRLLTAAGLAPNEYTSFVSRLVLRRDGFVSVRADYTGGEFTTPPLKFSGRELVLNVNTSATGQLRCELLNARHQPIEGYGLADCDVIHTANEIDRPVTWKGSGNLSALAGQPVRLRVAFRDTDLYAFQFRK